MEIDPELDRDLVVPIDQDLVELGTSGLLTAVLRGEVEYAFPDSEPDWLVLLYKNPKRAVRINTHTAEVMETDYYDQPRH